MIRPANMPMPHVTRMAHSVLDMYSVKSSSTSLHRPIPAPEPDPEPNPAPDAVRPSSSSRIPPADWDELFHAIQIRLETCVNDTLSTASQLPVDAQKAMVKKAVLECVEAMRQLHTALQQERQAQQAH